MIYPLGKEVWAPFGMGNGMEAGDKLENVTITHLSDLKFTALIDYGEENVFFNALILVPSGDAFLIDYIETTLIDVQQGDINLPFLQNLALAKFQLGTNPDDTKPSSGKLLLMAYRKRIMFVPSGGKNFVATSDVATTVCNALTEGKNGQHYLASGINLSFKEFYLLQSRIGALS